MTPAVRSEQDIIAARYQSTADWGEQHIILREGTSQGRLKYYAWQREILDAYDDLNVNQITMVMASRAGKTAVLLGMTGAAIGKDPQPVLYGHPNAITRKEFYEGKLIPMLESSPTLYRLTKDGRTNQGNIPIDVMTYPHGPMYSRVSGSKNAFASVGVRLCIGDELDKYQFNLDTGNPVGAMRQRIEGYQAMGKLVLASTPAVAVASLIFPEFLDGTRSRWHTPCPHCDAPWIIQAEQIKDDKLWHVCADKQFEHMHYCGARVSERERQMVLPLGHFVEEQENTHHKSYHLERIQSPASTLASVIASKNRAEKSTEHKIEYFTMVRAVPFEPKVTEDYPAERLNAAYVNELPTDAQLTARTMTVDVQRDRLEYQVHDWYGYTPWYRVHDSIEDYADKEEKWRRLEGLFQYWQPDAIAIDRKYRQKEVREMADKHLKYWLDSGKLWLIKGYEHKSFGDNVIRNEPNKRFPHDLTISVDEAKVHTRDYIDRMQFRVCGPVISDFNEQLLAEELIEVPSRNGQNKEWREKNEKAPNEAFDLSVYGYSMRVKLGFEFQRVSQVEYLDEIDDYLARMGA